MVQRCDFTCILLGFVRVHAIFVLGQQAVHQQTPVWWQTTARFQWRTLRKELYNISNIPRYGLESECVILRSAWLFFKAEGTASFLHEVFMSQNLPFQIFQFDMCREPLLYGATGSCDGLNKFAELMSYEFGWCRRCRLGSLCGIQWPIVAMLRSHFVHLFFVYDVYDGADFGELLRQHKKSKYG